MIKVQKSMWNRRTTTFPSKNQTSFNQKRKNRVWSFHFWIPKIRKNSVRWKSQAHNISNWLSEKVSCEGMRKFCFLWFKLIYPGELISSQSDSRQHVTSTAPLKEGQTHAEKCGTTQMSKTKGNMVPFLCSLPQVLRNHHSHSHPGWNLS